jgi:hypothetical protein
MRQAGARRIADGAHAAADDSRRPRDTQWLAHPAPSEAFERLRRLTGRSAMPTFVSSGLGRRPAFPRRFVQALPCPRFEGGMAFVSPPLAPMLAGEGHD